MPRRSQPGPETEIDPAPHTQDFTVGGRIVTTARAAIPGFSFTAPRAWATDAPEW